jgi:prepilin-type N-terminal cleavage/methylation domain-containing protein
MHGHTLMEMLVVTALLGMAAGLLMTPLACFQKSCLLFSTGRHLAAELREARIEAGACHGMEKVAFHYGAGRWRLQKILTGPDGSETAFPAKSLPENIGLISNFPGDLLSFNSSGNPSRSGEIVLGLSGFSKKIKIVVSPVGRIRTSNAY